MNHSVELLEAINSGAFQTSSTLEAARRLYPMWQNLLPQAVGFYGGQSDDIRNLTRVPELFKLPFPTVWAEFDRVHPQYGTIVFGVLAVSDIKQMFGEAVSHIKRMFGEDHADGHNFAAWTFFRVKSVWSESGGGWCTSTGGFSAVVPDGGDDQRYRDLAPLLTEAVQSFVSLLSALNCRNVRRVEQLPDAQLQRARQRRGKQPFKSYWVLELKPQAVHGVELGGSHASPRIHIRRGHPREFAPGEWTWVRHTVVGNKANGVVEKDYTFRPQP